MKNLVLSMLIVLTIALTACSSSSTATPSGSSNNLSTETQLAEGTLKLEGTSQDISLEQAKDLVVYWQVYKELSQSDTAAQAEIDGLIAQIQETMTDDQMQAINDMNISQQDVLTSMQGVTVVSSNASDSTITVPSGTGIQAGGPPADGGGAPPDGGIPADMGGAVLASSSDQSQSAPADSGLAGTAGVPSALVEAVIQSLQQKIAA